MKPLFLIFFCFLIFSAFSQVQLSQFKLYSAGVESFKAGNHKSCIESMTQFLRHPLRNKAFEPNAYYERGISYYAIEDYQKAAADLRTAIYGGVFEKANANLFLGKSFAKLDNKEEATKAFTAAIDINQKPAITSAALYERAVVHESNGQAPLALQDLKLALEKNGNNQEARNKLDELEPKEVYTTGRGNEPKQKAPITPNNKVQSPAATNSTVLSEEYQGEKRYALVVGNSAYPKEIGALKNPANDAQDIAAELKRCKFEVELLMNATHRQIEIAANNLFKKLSEGPKDQTVGLFFYAGHGLQFEGTNYLVPVDASITTPTDVVYACYPADKILGKMEFANTRMNIVILDACRSNPFPATTRGGPQGLAQVRAAKGSYVAFATAPGSVASDGAGRNGLYTQELLKALRKPNLTIEQVFKEVRQKVSELSDGKQSTWDNSNIVGDFYFKLN